MALSKYEKNALDKVRDHKQEQIDHSPRTYVPQKVKDQVKKASEKARQVPGSEKVVSVAGDVMQKAGGGVGRMMSRSSQLTLSDKRVLRAYCRHGHKVDVLSDIRALDLRIVDKEASFKALNNIYASAAALEGGATAVAITGGQIAAGSGVGAAPGLTAVAGAMTGDAAAVLLAASRVVGHTAIYYGYDPNDPGEEIFMLSVIGLGTATTASARIAAYSDLAFLTQKLVRGATWSELNRSLVTRIVQAFSKKFADRLTKKKLGQLAPFVGIGISAGLNYKMISDIGDSAYWAYRERFLLEKSGEVGPDRSVNRVAPVGDGDNGDIEEPISIVELLNEAGVDVEIEPKPRN